MLKNCSKNQGFSTQIVFTATKIDPLNILMLTYYSKNTVRKSNVPIMYDCFVSLSMKIITCSTRPNIVILQPQLI